MSVILVVLMLIAIIVGAGLYTLVAIDTMRREETADDAMWELHDRNEFKRRAAVRARRASRKSLTEPTENHEPDQAPVTRRCP